MNSVYEPYWHQAMQLKHQTQDLINDHSYPQAHALLQETTQLVDDIELKRKPESIENRIKTIQHQLIRVRAQGEEVMSYGHSQRLHQNYEQMRVSVRRLPGY